MPSITNADAARLQRLRETARDAWNKSQMIKASGQGSILKTDVAIQALYAALIEAERVDLSPTRRTRKKAKQA